MSQVIQGRAGDVVAQIALRVPVELRDWYREQAAEEGRSMNSQICVVLRRQMQQDKAAACGGPPEGMQNVR